MPEETRLFIRSFLFALVIAVVYWIVSSDYVGTILLGGFSVASLTLFSMLRRGQPTRSAPAGSGRGLLSRIGDLVGTTEHAGQEQPFEDESGRIPAGSAAPVLLGIGIALIGFGLIFGVWSMIAGAIFGPPRSARVAARGERRVPRSRRRRRREPDGTRARRNPRRGISRGSATSHPWSTATARSRDGSADSGPGGAGRNVPLAPAARRHPRRLSPGCAAAR